MVSKLILRRLKIQKIAELHKLKIRYIFHEKKKKA